MKRLGDIIDLAESVSAGVVVTGLAVDSRRVVAGDAFFAMPGVKGDGLAHAGEAAARGAVVVIGERAPADPKIPFVRVADVRLALAQAASRTYPGRPAKIVAVTGTSGKTSVAAFTRQIWERCGHVAASLGTIGVVSGPWTKYGSLTTPEPIELHRTLEKLASLGVTHLAMEASSHGLDQKRLDGIAPAAVAFTNFSRDHMDYHATTEDYFAAKMRLFRALAPKGAFAVVDADTSIGARALDVAREAGLRPFGVGRAGGDIQLRSVEREGFSTEIALEYEGRSYRVALPLPGDFQVSNALVAAGLAIATGDEPAAAFAALEHLEGAPGRLEKIGVRGGAQVFVDYAHKPDALEKALASLRPFVSGKLVVVFGCGGDRDPGKRPMMGEIATRLADVVIVTDDNPRSEKPTEIRAAILAAAPGALDVGDRAEAIRVGIDGLHDGDALVIAGKGHEAGQIVGDVTHPFSDADVARGILEQLKR